MNGDTASNRTSYSSTIDTIDLKAIANANLDMTDSTLKDQGTSSSETLAEKPKKKVNITTKKLSSTSAKKKAPTDKTTPTKNSSTRAKTASGGGMSRSGSDKGGRSTASKTAANGVFDRLSGSTKSRPISASSRATSRESVMSVDSMNSTSTTTDDKTVKIKRSSLNSRPNTSKTNSSPGEKVTHKKLVRKSAPNDNGSTTSAVRRTTSAVSRTPTTSVAGAMRPKSQRSSLNSKPVIPPAEGGSIEDRASFLKKMLGSKASAVKVS